MYITIPCKSCTELQKSVEIIAELVRQGIQFKAVYIIYYFNIEWTGGV